MVARTLLLRPRVIVADEPVSMIDASLRATVLGNLLQLKRMFGISLVYITHDLTTAYQISDRIIVLYQGEVVESGDPEQVVRSPQHPYTQLLIRSIPEPDPDRRWGEDEEEDESDEQEAVAEGPGVVAPPGQRAESGPVSTVAEEP
jgi:peptide/nickel transport system ATP-binding protein